MLGSGCPSIPAVGLAAQAKEAGKVYPPTCWGLDNGYSHARARSKTKMVPLNDWLHPFGESNPIDWKKIRLLKKGKKKYAIAANVFVTLASR